MKIMKSLPVPIAIIVALIAFFVIVDRKGFNRDNVVQSVQTGSKASNDLRHIDFSTYNANRGTTTEINPSETDPVAETNPKEMAMPAAVPAVTQDEAEKLNAFAIFLSTAKKTVVEGEITERSELPNPQESDYPNCRFTAHFNGNSIKSGESCPKELSLVIEGFESYKILDTDKLKPGDKVKCTIIPFEDLPEEDQSTQQADDLNLFLLRSYYVVNVQIIQVFEDNGFMPKSGIFFSDGNEEYISIFERKINPPIPLRIKDAQDNAISDELKKMNDFFNEYDDKEIEICNQKFAEAWEKEKAKDPPDYNRLRNDQGEFVWRNIDNSFWVLPTKYKLIKKVDPIPQDALDSFKALKDVCEANGVQLIVSIIPNFHAVSSRVINKEFRDVPDFQLATYVKQLSEIGVEAFYSTDALIQQYNKYPFAFHFPFDDHPADTIQDVQTDLIRNKLERYNIQRELDPALFTVKQNFHHALEKTANNAFPQNCDIADNAPGSPFSFREVYYNGEKITNPEQSSILVIGNSFIQYPMPYPDSFPTLLTYKMHAPVKWYRIGWLGPFTDCLYQILARPEYFLQGKKVLILQFGMDALSRIIRGYSMVNLAKADMERLLLNNKTLKRRFVPESNIINFDSIKFKNFYVWFNSLPDSKTVFQIQNKDKKVQIDRIGQLDDFDDSKPIIAVIPATAYYDTSCEIEINGITQMIPAFNYAQNAKFFNLAFELPIGTKEIIINVTGDSETPFAIKDIQLWQ